jgi:hypothetical protein
VTASGVFLTDFHTLDTRVDIFKAVVASYAAQYPQTSAHGQRELLLTRTLLCCATIQLYAHTNLMWDNEDSKILRAAIAAADAINDLDFSRLAHVDPLLGVS